MKLIEFLSRENQSIRFFELNIQNFIPPNYNDDLDQRCHKQTEALEKEDFDFLLLPLSVTQNFAEFSGLILALHIRLSSSKKLRNVPILFYGYIDQINLLKLTPLARVLLTENIVYADLTKDEFAQIASTIKIYKVKDFNINKFLSTIEIHPPANYDSHHSIDNEYSLIQWSKYIGCYDKLPEHFRKEFDSRLYFKYLNIKNNIVEINNKEQFSLSLPSKTTILHIDDEEHKGWGSFYKSYFQFSPNANLVSSEINFKECKDQSDVIEQIKEKVRVVKPEIVLLDLRLIDNDFEQTIKPEMLTGIKAIETIKEIDRGIQVIITTASNKAWNFNLSHQKGSYDFIIKDGFYDPQKSIKRLKDVIELCAKRAKYLKPIWENINNAIQSWNNYNIPTRKNVTDIMHDKNWHLAIKLNVTDFLNNAYYTLENENQKERFTISIILLYRILELTKEFFIYQKGNYSNKDLEYFWDQDNSVLPYIYYKDGQYQENSRKGDSIPTLNQIYAIYYKLNNSINKKLFKDLYQINNYRNSIAIHPDKRFKEESLEYKYDNDFPKFCDEIINYSKAVCDYVSSFK